MANYTKSQLNDLKINDIQGLAAREGLSIPKSKRKAEQIQMFLDLMSIKRTEEEAIRSEEIHETVIDLKCGHPHTVKHVGLPAAELKKHLAAAKKSATCPRCPAATPAPAAVAEPEGEVSEAAEVPAPAPTHPKKSSAPSKAKAAKANRPAPSKPKAKKTKTLKKEPTGWGFSSKEGGHADSSKALLRAKTPDAKASVTSELIEATGWTAKVVETSEEHAVLQATLGDALIVIRWQPLEAKKLDIRHYKTPDHKGAGLLNVSAALKACRAAVDISKTSSDRVESEVHHAAAPELTLQAA